MSTRGKPTRRFTPSKGFERVVPVILITLLLFLIGTVLLVLLAVFGLVPAA